MPSSVKHPSRVPMWKGVKYAYVIIAMCLFPIAIGGYWAYGNLVSTFFFFLLSSSAILRTFLSGPSLNLTWLARDLTHCWHTLAAVESSNFKQ